MGQKPRKITLWGQIFKKNTWQSPVEEDLTAHRFRTQEETPPWVRTSRHNQLQKQMVPNFRWQNYQTFRSPGEGDGKPLQYSCLENSMDREAWRGTVHGVAESHTSTTFTFMSLSLSKCQRSVLPNSWGPSSSVHEIFQARILEWVVISFSRVSSQPRDQTQVFCTAGRFFTDWATGKSSLKMLKKKKPGTDLVVQRLRLCPSTCRGVVQ